MIHARPGNFPLALGAAAVVHLAVIAVVLAAANPADPPAGEMAPLTVTLGQPAAMAARRASAPPPDTVSPPTGETAEASVAEPQPVAPVPTPQAAAETVPERRPVPAAPAIIPKGDLVATADVVESAPTAEKVETVPAVQPEPQPMEPKPAIAPVERPVPTPKLKPPPRPPQIAAAEPAEPSPPADEPRPPTDVARQVPAVPAPLGPDEDGDASENEVATAAVVPSPGTAAAPQGGGDPSVRADYFARVRAWLEQHKRYPRGARLRRQEGTVVLRFVMDRSGKVLSYEIARSSGHGDLDEAVEELIGRAAPLPKIPADLAETRLTLAVPIAFELR